ncbi:MAG: hypothetical protein K8R40_11665 [Anaerolineaceae bacterium]|nr:hypothetical protein [Anaerolineaceae bacterium]
MMESQLFSVFNAKETENNIFGKDIEFIVKTAPEKVDIILQNFLAINSFSNEVEKKEALNDLGSETGLSEFQINSIIKLSLFFLSELTNSRNKKITLDTPESWTNDLHSIGLLKKEDTNNFLRFSRQVKAMEKDFNNQQLKRQYEVGLYPSFKGYATTIELRAIQESRYYLGENVENYEPSILGYMPIVSLKLMTTGEETIPVFQLTSEDIDYLIDGLTAAKIDLNNFEEKIKYLD